MGVTYFLLLSCLGLVITAQAQDCGRPSGGANMKLMGYSSGARSFPDGTKVTFACDVGYMTTGASPTIKCTAGNWSSVRLTCAKRSCGSPGEVDNGEIDFPNGVEFGSKAVITCNDGYKLVGNSEITCGDQGWKDKLPQCDGSENIVRAAAGFVVVVTGTVLLFQSYWM